MEVPPVGRRSIKVDGAADRGVVEAVGASWTAAFWKSARIRGDDDWGAVISGGGVGGKSASEGRGGGEMDGVSGVMWGVKRCRGMFEYWARRGHCRTRGGLARGVDGQQPETGSVSRARKTLAGLLVVKRREAKRTRNQQINKR